MSTRGIRSIQGGLVLHEADAGYCKILSTDPRPLILGQCGPQPTLQSSVRPSASFHDHDAARRQKQLPMSAVEYRHKYLNKQHISKRKNSCFAVYMC